MKIYGTVQTKSFVISKAVGCPTLQELVEFLQESPLNFIVSMVSEDDAYRLQQVAANTQYIRDNIHRISLIIGYEGHTELENKQKLNHIVEQLILKMGIDDQNHALCTVSEWNEDKDALIFPPKAANE